MVQIQVTAHEEYEIKEQVGEGEKEIEKIKMEYVQRRKSAVIVSGDALSVIMGEEGIKKRFLEIALMVDVVLACRVSPKQKADIV